MPGSGASRLPEPRAWLPAVVSHRLRPHSLFCGHNGRTVATAAYHDHVAVTPARHIRISDELWSAITARAAADGTTATGVVTAALGAWLRSALTAEPRVPAGPGTDTTRASGHVAAPRLTEPAPDVPAAARPAQPQGEAERCPHPMGRRLKGLCMACGSRP